MERVSQDELRERRLHNLTIKEAELRAQLTEVSAEKQRLINGQHPQDLSDVLRPKRVFSDFPAADIFWRRTINFDGGYLEQANLQSDNSDV